MPQARLRGRAFARKYRLDSDECVSVAYEGLVEAAPRFDSTAGVLFWTFAQRRVDGALLDFLRKHDQLSKSRNVKTTVVGLDEALRCRFRREGPIRHPTDLRAIRLAVSFLSPDSRNLIMTWATSPDRPLSPEDRPQEFLKLTEPVYRWRRYFILKHLKKVLLSRGITKVSDCI